MKINDEDRAVILFSCPDRRGIVAETAEISSIQANTKMTMKEFFSCASNGR